MVELKVYILRLLGQEQKNKETEEQLGQLREAVEVLIEKINQLDPQFKAAFLLQPDERSEAELDEEIGKLRVRQWELRNYSPVNRAEIKKRNTDLLQVDTQLSTLEGQKIKLLMTAEG